MTSVPRTRVVAAAVHIRLPAILHAVGACVDDAAARAYTTRANVSHNASSHDGCCNTRECLCSICRAMGCVHPGAVRHVTCTTSNPLSSNRV